MKKSIYLIMAVCSGLVACTGTSSNQHTEAVETPAGEENAHAENVFHAHIAASSLATEITHKEKFGHVLHSVGQILPVQGMEKTLIARSAGIVTFEGRQMTEGKVIRKDQVLFAILSDGTSDNNLLVKYKEAESNWHLAEEEYRRKASLAEKQIVSQSELLRAKRDFETAEVRFSTLKEHFQAGKQQVTPGMDGFIQKILVTEGDFVQEGQPVAIVSQNRHLLVKAQVPSKYYPEMKYIRTANFHPRNGLETYTLEALDGHVLSYSKAVDPSQPLLSVTFQIANKNEFLSGSFLDIYIHSESPEEVITVANEALVEQMGSYFVFLKLDEEHYEKREVTVGKTDGIRTVILSGLSEEERVVTKGAILLKLAQATGKLDPHAGHAH